jgi:hypothetical protein
MIIRILGEGQYDVAETERDRLNELDSRLESAVEAGDESAFTESLAGLLTAVRAAGTALPDDSLEDSDLFLPPADASLEEVREMLTDEGLIPG